MHLLGLKVGIRARQEIFSYLNGELGSFFALSPSVIGRSVMSSDAETRDAHVLPKICGAENISIVNLMS
jgi:hypothetical protein